MQLNVSLGQSIPYTQGAQPQSIGAPTPQAQPPAIRREARTTNRKKVLVDGLEPVGMIYGNVGTLSFNCGVTGPVEKMEYVQAKHELVGWVLGQVSEIVRKTDFTIDGIEQLQQGTPVQIDEKETAVISVVGYRDDRNLLQVPRTPLKAGEV